MFWRILLVFLVVVPIVVSEDLSKYTSITSEVFIDGEVNLVYLEGGSSLDYFEAKLNFFPMETPNQEVGDLNFNFDPDARIFEDDFIKYRWSNGNIEKLKFGLSTEVKSSNMFRKIDKEVSFPVTYDESLKEYYEGREFIDITQLITKRANRLVEGEDHLYSAIFKIAEWVRTNVEYDLNTLTEKTVQKSSWVLKQKYGVCDEITNLFVSMLRSLKIPVKYVTGLAYNDLTDEWGPHAWAEVYFKDYGWLPFDITFGQYGWIDAGHIKMMEAFDANDPGVEYNWRAVKVAIDSKEFNIGSELKEKGSVFDPLLDLELKLLKNNVGGGSYVPIEVSVINLQPYYLSSLVYVTIAPGVVGDNSKAILLKPMQERKLYWLVNVTDDLNEDSMYTGDVVVVDSFGAIARKKLNFAKGFDVLGYDEAKIMINTMMEDESKVMTYDLILDCDAEKKYYFRDENMNVVCNVENKGNTPQSTKVCLGSDCKDVFLSINEAKEINFVYDLDNYHKQLFIKADTGGKIEGDLLEIEVFDEPNFEIKNIHYDEVSYNERGAINIDVSAIPYVSKIEVSVDEVGEFEFDNLIGFKTLEIPFKAWEFKEGNNFVNVKVKYYKGNKPFEIEKGFSLDVKEVGFFKKILVMFKKLF